MTTYRFHSSETVGRITLLDDAVECEFRRNFSRWHYKAPYSILVANPIRKWTTPSGFWACLLVAGGGFTASIIRLIGFDMSMPLHIAIPVLLVSLCVLVYTYRIRREEWISIPTTAPEFWITYCKMGRDSESFEAFTTQLMERIRESRLGENGG